MAEHNQRGRSGEQLAREHLIQKGYEILDENWTYDRAEIDLIAFDGKQLIFVEVKLRSTAFFGYPEEFVDDRKQLLLEKASLEYIYRMEWEGEIRYDIISIIAKEGITPEIKHIEDAFFPY